MESLVAYKVEISLTNKLHLYTLVTHPLTAQVSRDCSEGKKLKYSLGPKSQVGSKCYQSEYRFYWNTLTQLQGKGQHSLHGSNRAAGYSAPNHTLHKSHEPLPCGHREKREGICSACVCMCVCIDLKMVYKICLFRFHFYIYDLKWVSVHELHLWS